MIGRQFPVTHRIIAPTERSSAGASLYRGPSVGIHLLPKPHFAIRGISRGALAHGLWREPDANACRLIQSVPFSTNHEMWFRWKPLAVKPHKSGPLFPSGDTV